MVIDGTMEMSKAEKIRMLEVKLQEMNSHKVSKTTGASYGNGSTLERFSMAHLNRSTNKDLMPCPRRPPGKKAAAAE